MKESMTFDNRFFELSKYETFCHLYYNYNNCIFDYVQNTLDKTKHKHHVLTGLGNLSCIKF